MKALAIFLAALLSGLAWGEPILIRMMAGPSWGIPPKEATDPRSQARRSVFESFQKENPDIRVVNAGGLTMTGDKADSMFLMSMAGDTSPDVFYVNFRQYYNYIDQGFCRSLDDLISRNPDSMQRANPTVRKVLRSFDGHIYAVPWYQVAMGLYYRKDHFLEAGLDPGKPPKNWDEFYYCAQKLAESKPGREGFIFSNGPGYHWVNFAWAAGGEIVQEATGGFWKSAVASAECAQAMDFYRKLVTATWKDAKGGRAGPAALVSGDFNADIRAGKASMWLSYTNDVVLSTSEINPALLGVAALPVGPAGRANEINAGMWAINSQIKDPRKLEACWKFIRFFAGDSAARITTERYVELGLGNLLNPVWLKKFGYEEMAGQVDRAYLEANDKAFHSGHPEPYGRNCQQVYIPLDAALTRAALEPQTPSIEILRATAREMDRKLLNYTPPDVLAKQRGWAMGIFLLIAVGCTFIIGRFVRRGFKGEEKARFGLPAGASKKKAALFVGLCLLPAAGSLLLWSYYPLSRGLVIAFQDYRILKVPKWVGLDNFISVFTQPIFYRSLINSFVYVALSITIGFFIPLLLAIALNEIPRAKVFFRTVFYLPAMTSGIVIALLWRQFYDKAPTGLLNSLLAPVIELVNPVLRMLHLAPIQAAHDWLGDPSLAMFAVVLPGIWAGAGPGSILYLAALKNISAERYEAADIDGANWIQKIRYITLPGLRPLILINLLGVFIGGFKAMENIFVLTGGGPLYATHTIGLEIWTNAFMYLRFGYATAAAWVMGAILVGFTLIQIKNLTKMKFTAAKL